MQQSNPDPDRHRELFLFSKRYRGVEAHLSIAALDITDDFQLKWLNHIETPNLSVALAMRMSASIPFFFEPVEFEGHLFVDGGLVRNLPVDAFDCVHFSDLTACESWRCDAAPCGARVLALKLGASPRGIAPGDNVGFWTFAVGFLKGVLLRHLRDPVSQQVNGSGLVHFIDFSNHNKTRGIRGTSFGVTNKQKSAMVNAGYELTKQHLEAESCEWSRSSLDSCVACGLDPDEEPSTANSQTRWFTHSQNAAQVTLLMLSMWLAATRGFRSLPIQVLILAACLMSDMGLAAWVLLGLVLLVVAYALAGTGLRMTMWVRQKGLEVCGVRTQGCEACQRDWALNDVAGDIMRLERGSVEAMLRAHGMGIREDEAENRRRAYWVWYFSNFSFWRPLTYFGFKRHMNLRDALIMTWFSFGFGVSFVAVKMESSISLDAVAALWLERLHDAFGSLSDAVAGT